MELRWNFLKGIFYGSCGKFNIEEEKRKRTLLKVPHRRMWRFMTHVSLHMIDDEDVLCMMTNVWYVAYDM